MQENKLLSLFDGSGGFPLAASMCGISPVAAAEIEPYPIAVTRSRFPNMKHLGDISKVNGAEIEPVDVITFGAPCQDLSVAGKRAGLRHESLGDQENTRSGLFMEAVRIIKEMREATNGEYPRYAVYENVPGAFSSSKGEDFRIVLEEIIKIAEPSASMPPVPKGGWPYADSYCGDGWSLAYRVLDAQYWGVPQRRRRIYLVADFRTERAREVLFEREGLRGYFTEGGTPWKRTARDVEGSAGADNREGEGNCLTPWDYQTKRCFAIDGVFPTLSAGERRGQNQQSVCVPCAVTGFDGYNADVTGDVAATLGANCGISTGRNGVLQALCMATQQGGAEIMEDKCPTITAAAGMSGNNQPVVCYKNQPVALEPGIAAREGGHIYEGVSGTIRANAGDNRMAVAYADIILDDQGGSSINVRSDGKSPTLRAEAHGNVPCVMDALGCDLYNLAVSGKKAVSLTTASNAIGSGPTVAIPETYDSRGNGDGEICNTITGDHESRVTDYTSVVVEPVVFDGSGVTSPINSSNPQLSDPCHTLSTDSRNYVVAPVYSIQGNTIDREAKQNGAGVCESVSHTLNAVDRHGVVYAVDQGGGKSGANVTEDTAPTLCTTHGGEPAVVYALDQQGGKGGANFAENVMPTLCSGSHGTPHAVAYAEEPITVHGETVSGTLMSRDYKGAGRWDSLDKVVAIDRAFFNQGQNALYDPQLYEDGTNPTLVARGPNAVAVRYIVRRLTPTECARLQGFADRWGDIDPKEGFTDEEFAFWSEVRNTHAAINGKVVREYTKQQMITWYKKLHTDSSEYKMWGNGIALPTALYVLQGIKEALQNGESSSEAHL